MEKALIKDILTADFFNTLSSVIGTDGDEIAIEIGELISRFENGVSLEYYAGSMYGNLIVKDFWNDKTNMQIARVCKMRFLDGWERIYSALKYEYNPTMNYNEHEVIEHSGNDNNSGSTTYSGTNAQTNTNTGTVKDTESGTVSNSGNENIIKNETINSATSYTSTAQNPTGKTDNTANTNTSLTQNRDIENNETINTSLKIDSSNSGSSSTSSNLEYGHKITRDTEGRKADEYLSKNLSYEIEFREFYSFFDILVNNCVNLLSNGVWSDTE